MTRGFVFTIDATLSIFLMMLVLSAIVFLSAQAQGSLYSKVQMVRMGRDILAVMDKQDLLSPGNRSLIEGTLNSTLPHHIGAHMEVSTYYYDSGAFNLMSIDDYGDSAPANQTVYGARRDFVTLKNGRVANYSQARMTIWQR